MWGNNFHNNDVITNSLEENFCEKCLIDDGLWMGTYDVFVISFFRMKNKAMQAKKHRKILNVLRKLEFLSRKYHVSLSSVWLI